MGCGVDMKAKDISRELLKISRDLQAGRGRALVVCRARVYGLVHTRNTI